MILRLIIAIPFLIVLVLFSLSNRQGVTLAFWPTDYTLVDVPLSLVVLVAMGVAFLFGALFLWVSAIGARRRAARAVRAQRMLEAQVQELKARVVARPMSPGSTALSVR